MNRVFASKCLNWLNVNSFCFFSLSLHLCVCFCFELNGGIKKAEVSLNFVYVKTSVWGTAFEKEFTRIQIKSFLVKYFFYWNDLSNAGFKNSLVVPEIVLQNTTASVLDLVFCNSDVKRLTMQKEVTVGLKTWSERQQKLELPLTGTHTHTFTHGHIGLHACNKMVLCSKRRHIHCISLHLSILDLKGSNIE